MINPVIPTVYRSLGMMIESMAGKSGCLHGLCHDATPFTFSESNSAIDFFGKMLKEGKHLSRCTGHFF